MDPSEIEQGVRRLAPWYYLYDFDGVRTDIEPPSDIYGFRRVSCPRIMDGFWAGKSVLDVGCNEGGGSFGALDMGAKSIEGFDCREANIEKARFVASVLGHGSCEFSIANCDSWLADNPGKQLDIVMLCGILYHLTDPLRTIREYCDVAKEWIYVASCVKGIEEDGFTPFEEEESIASSEGALDSLMPHNGRTLITAFREHGFEAVHVGEVRKDEFWDGVNILLRNCREFELESSPIEGDVGDVDVHVAAAAVTEASIEISLACQNRTTEPARLRGGIRRLNASGDAEFLGEESFELTKCASLPDNPNTESVRRTMQVPLARGDASTFEVRFTNHDDARDRGGLRFTIRRQP